VVDILDEIAEDLRQERALRLVRRYGGLLVAAAVLVLVGVGAQQYWQARQARLANAAATQYLALTQQVDQPEGGAAPAQAAETAQALLEFAARAPGDYQALARLRAAALYAGAGQRDQAERLWTQIGADAATPARLRDAATLLWAQHALG
jgi:hypothetical protein